MPNGENTKVEDVFGVAFAFIVGMFSVFVILDHAIFEGVVYNPLAIAEASFVIVLTILYIAKKFEHE